MTIISLPYKNVFLSNHFGDQMTPNLWASSQAKRLAFHPMRCGISLIEILVVISIIGLLISLLMPAVQGARESARRLSCQNNLRQLALACQLHEGTIGHLPSDGWGWGWGPEAACGVGSDQPGGWLYNLLPYLEQSALHDQASGLTDAQRRSQIALVLQKPLAITYCPSRRSVAAYPYTQHNFPLVNSDPVTRGAKTDYAINSGDFIVDTLQGPADGSPSSVQNYPWPSLTKITGVSFVRSQFRMADILDGTTQTVLLGEKCISVELHPFGLSKGDDQSMYIGDDADIRRFTADAPLRDPRGHDEYQLFGSAHQEGCYVAMCDGSIRLIPFTINGLVFQKLGNRGDGEVVQLDN